MTDIVHEAFSQSQRHRALPAVRAAATVGVAGFILFAPVDSLLASVPLFNLFVARCVIIAAILAIWGITYHPAAGRIGINLAAFGCLVIGGGIVALTAMTGGGSSRYHEALISLFFGYAILMPASVTLASSLFITLIISYAIALLACGAVGPIPVFATNLALLILAALVALTTLIISNRLRANEFKLAFDLQQSNERLTAIDAAKKLFFANISHELRTPLTLILASTESLREAMEARGEDVPQDLVACRRNGIRLLREVDELLELSRLESATVRRKVRRFDLRAMANELAAQLQPLAARKDLSIAADLSAPSPMLIEADDSQIERVWLNLTANAIKYTPEGGTVTLGLRHADGELYEGWVEDTGLGIPAEVLRPLTDAPMQAASGGPNDGQQGAGLGLSLVRRIVEVHDGRLHVTSAAGRGTRVSFFLPKAVSQTATSTSERRTEQAVVPSERRRGAGLAEWDGVLRSQDEYRLWDIAELTERRSVARPADGGRGPTILLVDDNPDILELLGGVLGGSYRLMTAADGQEALLQARKSRPDLVLSDVIMPNMNGFQLLAAMRSDPDLHHVPVVLLTPQGQEEDRIAAGEGGADAYLAKPFHPQELRTILRNILRKQEAQAAAAIDERALALRVMAEGVAHDVLNPLGFVRGALLILSRLNSEASELLGTEHPRAGDLLRESNEFYKSGNEGLERAIAAIGELRRFSRGDTTSQVTRIDVNDVVKRTITVAATQGKVIPHFGATHGVTLRAGQLEQVLLNLVINAQQAAGANSEVHVTTWDDHEGRAVGIAVKDNGPGMDRSTLQRVFDPYFTTKQMGTGLGLTVSRQIIRDGRGTLSVESQTGKGSTFTILLPDADIVAQPAAGHSGSRVNARAASDR